MQYKFVFAFIILISFLIILCYPLFINVPISNVSTINNNQCFLPETIFVLVNQNIIKQTVFKDISITLYQDNSTAIFQSDDMSPIISNKYMQINSIQIPLEYNFLIKDTDLVFLNQLSIIHVIGVKAFMLCILKYLNVNKIYWYTSYKMFKGSFKPLNNIIEYIDEDSLINITDTSFKYISNNVNMYKSLVCPSLHNTFYSYLVKI